MTLPNDAAARKAVPLATGVLDYFPDALAAVAALSAKGNDQHNPGAALHWDRAKSGDEADALLRHLSQRGTVDSDGIRHSAKVAWRALALLQKELEAEEGAPLPRGARVSQDCTQSVLDVYVAWLRDNPCRHPPREGKAYDVTGTCAPFDYHDAFRRATPYDAHPLCAPATNTGD